MLLALLYIAVVVLLALDPITHPLALASSPAGVTHGHVLQLLGSGLIVDGPVIPQILALAVVLVWATRRLGAVRTWTVAFSAHVGATLVAYALVAALWLVDPGLVSPVTHAPDYGISVILVAGCAAILRQVRPAAVAPAAALLGATWLLWWWLGGSFSPIVLANLEHLLGFAIGASVGGLKRRRAVGVERVHGRVVPRLTLRPIALGPDHAWFIRRVDKPSA